MKKMLSIAVSVAVIAGLAACSSPGASTAPTDLSAPGPAALDSTKGVTDITLWHGLGAANGVALDKLVAEFNEANAGKIKVTATYQGAYPDLLAKYTAGVRSKSTPTVMLAGDIGTGYLTDVKQSVPAADMAAANPDDLKLSEIVSAGKNYYSVDGKQQAIPMAMSTPVLWANRDLLRKAGIDDRTDLSTLKAVASAARTVTEKTGQKGITQAADDWWIEQMAAGAGEEFCTPGNGRKGELATDLAINKGKTKEAFSTVADLFRSGVGLDGAPDGSAALTAFQAGKVGFMFYSSGILGALKKGTPFDYEALPYPTSGPKSTAGSVVGGSGLWLSATASDAQQVAGWKLETFMTSAAAQEEFSHGTGYVPVNDKVAASPTQKAYLAANPNFRVFTQQINKVPAGTPTSGCLSGAMTSIRAGNVAQMQAAYSGAKTVGAALDQAAADAAAAIKQYQEQRGK